MGIPHLVQMSLHLSGCPKFFEIRAYSACDNPLPHSSKPIIPVLKSFQRSINLALRVARLERLTLIKFLFAACHGQSEL